MKEQYEQLELFSIDEPERECEAKSSFWRDAVAERYEDRLHLLCRAPIKPVQ